MATHITTGDFIVLQEQQESAGRIEQTFRLSRAGFGNNPLLPLTGGLLMRRELVVRVEPSTALPGSRIRMAILDKFTIPSLYHFPDGRTMCLDYRKYFPHIFDEENWNQRRGVYKDELLARETDFRRLAFRLRPTSSGPMSIARGDGIPIAGSMGILSHDYSIRPCEVLKSYRLTGYFVLPKNDPLLSKGGSFYLSHDYLQIKIEGPSGTIPAQGYTEAGNLPAIDILPLGSQTLDTRSRQECRNPDRGRPLWPFSTVRLYRQHQHKICVEALRFGITRTLLAITLQHEGYGRSQLVQGRIDKYIEKKFGRDTIGTGQMMPLTAQALALKYDGEHISLETARHRLVYDSPWQIHMTAAYLFDLQSQFGLTDKEAFIAYAFGAEQIEELRLTRFQGREATRRGTHYDELYREIAGQAGYEARTSP
jgi:hypothetical protein